MNNPKIPKTWKCFIDGNFVRSESGRCISIEKNNKEIAYIPNASRKDLRNAIEASTIAFEKWKTKIGYTRGQILWRFAEILLSRKDEIANLIPSVPLRDAKKEVQLSVERIVQIAGWADKFQQVLGSSNPVNGPYHNFTLPTPIGSTVILPPKKPSLLSLLTLTCNALTVGCTTVVVSSIENGRLACALGEIAATSDLPNGTLNIITSNDDSLLSTLANHRGLKCIVGDLPPSKARVIKNGQGVDLKRVSLTQYDFSWWENVNHAISPWSLEPFLEFKTIWHPCSTM